MKINSVKDVRDTFATLLAEENFTKVEREKSLTDFVGTETLEIVGASFVADEETLFGEINRDYIHREESWYRSQSLSVDDIPGGAPTIWKSIASKDGKINSNYGWCIWSDENGRQFENVISELKNNPASRRAVTIYTRPSIWRDYNENGRSDFICTNAVQYLVRDGKVHSYVQMRSNDAIFGYKNDFAWQKTVLEEVASSINVSAGKIYWNVGSLHVYARHFYLVDHYMKTGKTFVSKKEYFELNPLSKFQK